MSNGKKIIIVMILAILTVVGVIGYLGYQSMNSTDIESSLVTVQTQVINNPQTRMTLNGIVETKETKSYIYDYYTYGKLWDTPVSVGQFVNKDDIIVESSKKDYKAPFDGYIVELNVDAAYKQAKDAYDNNEMIETPELLFTIVSSDYYIETKITEYEINRLPENKKVTYSIRAYDAEKFFDTSIRRLGSAPTVTTGSNSSDVSTYSLTLNMDSGKEHARIGNHVTIRIEDANKPALIIPKDAVINLDGNLSVFIATTNEAGTTTVHQVQITAQEVDGGYEVTTGLADGDEIVSAGVSGLTDGQTVISATNISEENTTTNA